MKGITSAEKRRAMEKEVPKSSPVKTRRTLKFPEPVREEMAAVADSAVQDEQEEEPDDQEEPVRKNAKAKPMVSLFERAVPTVQMIMELSYQSLKELQTWLLQAEGKVLKVGQKSLILRSC